MYDLDEQGNPFPVDDLAPGIFADNRRVVGNTTVGAQRVSTVFLVIDHGFGMGPPVLWETMVFGLPGDEPQWRYTSKDDAMLGHARLVAQLRSGVPAAELDPFDSVWDEEVLGGLS